MGPSFDKEAGSEGCAVIKPPHHRAQGGPSRASGSFRSAHLQLASEAMKTSTDLGATPLRARGPLGPSVTFLVRLLCGLSWSDQALRYQGAERWLLPHGPRKRTLPSASGDPRGFHCDGDEWKAGHPGTPVDWPLVRGRLYRNGLGGLQGSPPSLRPQRPFSSSVPAGSELLPRHPVGLSWPTRLPTPPAGHAVGRCVTAQPSGLRGPGSLLLTRAGRAQRLVHEAASPLGSEAVSPESTRTLNLPPSPVPGAFVVRGPSPGTDALMLLPSQVSELRHIPPALRTGDPRKSTRTAAGGSVPRPGLLPASAWEPPTPTPCSSESAGSRALCMAASFAPRELPSYNCC
ncbi:hypothetical protein PAL_GLEAN10022816 [Pteropus alecto]|uniref:Uncharacterized protein n=1 Tax=Pteropus alecto TaxID=9402 RepID=L5K4A0_PTEAL|nr:hypothetical protein PAL_GLEAN10022816 [Pteropus alecto]